MSRLFDRFGIFLGLGDQDSEEGRPSQVGGPLGLDHLDRLDPGDVPGGLEPMGQGWFPKGARHDVGIIRLRQTIENPFTKKGGF